METEEFNMTSNFSFLIATDDVSLRDSTYIIIFYYLGAVVVLGAGGNLAVIYTFIRCKNLHNPTNMLIVNLAVSDVIVALTGTPLSVTSAYFRRWIFGRVGCNAYAFVNYYCGCISLNSLAMISLFRYIIVVRRSSRKLKRLSIYAIIGIHLYTLFFSFPPLLGWNRFVLEGYKIGCDLDFRTKTSANMSYICYMFAFLFFAPLSLIVWSYWKIYRVINLHRKAIIARSSSSCHWPSSTDSTLGSKKTRKAATGDKAGEIVSKLAMSRRRSFIRQHMTIITILMTIAVFIVVWLPYCVVSLWTMLGDEKTVPKVATVIPNLFAKSCIIYNPFVYVILNPKFRRALIHYCTPRNCFASSRRRTKLRM